MLIEESLAAIAGSALDDIIAKYREDFMLPNICALEDSHQIKIMMGDVGERFTMVFSIYENAKNEYYLDFTAYFAQDDFYVNDDTIEKCFYSVRAAPRGKIFNDQFEVRGSSIPEALLDGFIYIRNNLAAIIKQII